MKESFMNKPEDEFTLQLSPRPRENVSLDIPVDTLANLQKVAASRDMSLSALLKLYIGQGLRQDLAKSFSSRVIEATAEVLAKHISSEAELENILQEIRAQTTS